MPTFANNCIIANFLDFEFLYPYFRGILSNLYVTLTVFIKQNTSKAMKTAIVAALFLIFFTCSCKNNDVPSDTPSCIKDMVERLKKSFVSNPPASVWQYTFNNQTVYYIPPVCCDVYSDLYDDKCNLICHPDGGFTGMGDGKCPDFLKNRKDPRLIWSDDRK